jgi:hypothetical protein
VCPLSSKTLVYNGGPSPLDGTAFALNIVKGSQQKNRRTVMFDHPVQDFVILDTSPWRTVRSLPRTTHMRSLHLSLSLKHFTHDTFALSNSLLHTLSRTQNQDEAEAVAVLLADRLVVLDLKSDEFLPFQLPHSWELHTSCITCVRRYNNCTPDLFAALRAADKQSTTGKPRHSPRAWPLAGRKAGAKHVDFPELIVTGHSDGTVSFWKEGGNTPSLLLTVHLPTASSELNPAIPSGGMLGRVCVCV